jgi:hypothetical protein
MALLHARQEAGAWPKAWPAQELLSTFDAAASHEMPGALPLLPLSLDLGSTFSQLARLVVTLGGSSSA